MPLTAAPSVVRWYTRMREYEKNGKTHCEIVKQQNGIPFNIAVAKCKQSVLLSAKLIACYECKNECAKLASSG